MDRDSQVARREIEVALYPQSSPIFREFEARTLQATPTQATALVQIWERSPPKSPIDPSTKSEGDVSYDPLQEHTQVAKNPNKPILDRWERAFCRFLVQRHNIPQAILREHFTCAQSTISKAVKNQYAQPDDTDQDAGILSSGPNLKANLKKVKLLEKKPRSVAKKSEGHSEPSRRRSRGSKTHTVSVCLSSGDFNCSEPAPPATAHREASSPDPSFLRKFAAKVSLDERWYQELKDAGFDEDSLRVFAGLPTYKINKFIEDKFPKMSAVTRFLFLTAIEALAIPVE
ncbi:hypothetical protein B0H19DRAFT_1241073 [Mycena capillaripes]|nr:hypothetical protein B0H19DRAFT_1241073 [Mycena capillaripes]